MGVSINITRYGREKDAEGKETGRAYVTWEPKNYLYTDKKTNMIKDYTVKWTYYAKLGFAINAETTTTTARQSFCTVPDTATKMTVKITANPKTHKVSGKDQNYFTAVSKSQNIIIQKDKTPDTPSAPDLVFEDGKMKMSLEITDTKANYVWFQLVNNNSKDSTIDLPYVKIPTTRYVSCIYSNAAKGVPYKVRARALYISSPKVSDIEGSGADLEITGYQSAIMSEWSELGPSGEGVYSVTSAPSITKAEASSETAVKLTWQGMATATEYVIEACTDYKKFGISSADIKSISVDGSLRTYIFEGLDAGETWYFRIRTTNSSGNSKWSYEPGDTTIPINVTIGKKPEPPTTWSDFSTCKIGEMIYLNWTHNAPDNSKQRAATIRYSLSNQSGAVEFQVITEDTRVALPTTEDQLSQIPESYRVKAQEFLDKIKDGYYIKMTWWVKTEGAINEYSEFSTARKIDIYTEPTLTVSKMTDPDSDYVTKLPLKYKLQTDVSTTGYSVSVIALEGYDDVDDTGEIIHIPKNEEIYSQYTSCNIALKQSYGETVEFNAGNINLKENIKYKIVFTAVFEIGLTNEQIRYVTPNWETGSLAGNIYFEPGYDKTNYIVNARAWYVDENSMVDSNVTLDVYRLNYDGTITIIENDLSNSQSLYITDPHPSLNYARYRVSAKSKLTGEIIYEDFPALPIQEKSVIVQWDENYSTMNLDSDNIEYAPEESIYQSSAIKLPFNIDVSPRQSRDKTLASYAGRENPVAYYGTQRGETLTISLVIVKTDEEMLYQIRKLANYRGNVYVREPSGVGYLASIEVNYDIKHLDLTIPVTFNITRVEDE